MRVASNKADGLLLVQKLVDRFASGKPYYKSSSYSETAARLDFIDPLLCALGWDVTDSGGLGRRREVVVENRVTQSVMVAGDNDWDDDLTEAELAARNPSPTFPDYVLRLDAAPRIVVEAKKPSVSLKRNAPSFQAKSYAWSMRLPMAILTDFEELRVFDARFRPGYSNPDGGVIPGLDLHYTQYATSWDALWNLASREAVAAGSLGELTQTPRGSQTVDRAFLAELGEWRLTLAADLIARNPDLDRWELAEATQRILDRIVFVRTLEDRGLTTGTILRKFARMTDSYVRATGDFRRLDAVYNGQLFAEHFSERLDVSDGVFQRLVENLYFPYSPYRFDAVPPELLGSIYEQFLGREIEITASRQVQAVEKPEVRHAGGVYYTPRWVVDRVVKTVLEPLVTGKTPRGVANLRILDPACGSGAFLLGAFDFLVSWHEWYYAQHPLENPSAHFETSTGERKLTADAKSQILANNLYGVDVDPQAVEVTQMSLYLALLSGENLTSLESQTRLFEYAYLPKLDKNIRCGNSLVDPVDVPNMIYDNVELLRRINPFTWRDSRTGFGAVFAERGGFDAVIGNPPYTRTQVLRSVRPEEAFIYQANFHAAAEGSYDISSLFVENGLQLLRGDGQLGFITSRTFCETASGQPLRKLLASGRHVREIVDFVDGLVFGGVAAYTLLLFLSKNPSKTFRLTRVVEPPSAAALEQAASSNALSAMKSTGTLTEREWSLDLPAEEALLQRLGRQNRALQEYCKGVVFQGVVTGADYIYRLSDLGPDPQRPGHHLVQRRDDEAAQGSIEEALLRPVYAGSSDLGRFLASEPHEVLLLPYARSTTLDRFRLLSRETLANEYPSAWRWLTNYEEVLRARSGNWTDDNWWSYSRRQNLERFDEPKVLIPYMIERLCSQLDHGSHYFVNVSTGGYGIPIATVEDGEYLAAILNSRLLSWVLRRYSRAFRGGWFAARKGNLVRLPIATPTPVERNQIVQLAAQCRSLATRLSDARSDHARELALRQYRYVVDSFDNAVEELYKVSLDEQLLLGQ